MKHRKLCNRINSENVNDRIDAEYYTKANIINEDMLNQFTNVSMEELVDPLISNNIADLTSNGSFEFLRGIDFTSNAGVPFIRTQNVLEGYIDNNDILYVANHCKGMVSKSLCNAGDLVVCRKGKVGSASSVVDNFSGASISENITRFSLLNDFDADFISSFLNSKQGRTRFLRESTGVVQKWINNEKLRKIRVIRLNDTVEKYIGNKVRQAETLREWAKRSQLKLDELMKSILRGCKKPTKIIFNRVDKNEINAGRLEAEFYRPEVKWAEDEVRGSKFESKQLKNLVKRIKDGPGGWGVSTNDYVNEGIPVIRSVNIVDGVCDLKNSVFISIKKHHDLIAHRVKRGSVVLSVRGTIGRAAVFDDDFYEEASINAAVVTIDCEEYLLPHYLAEFLNSKVGKIQSNRLANGAVQLNMNLNETGDNWIPVPTYEFQKNIETLRKKRLFKQKVSFCLPEAAKQLVEALIENKLTEQELINAQQALERGDNTLDRQILSRLTPKGIDHEDGAPLFTDLDQLYDLLNQAENFQEVTP